MLYISPGAEKSVEMENPHSFALEMISGLEMCAGKREWITLLMEQNEGALRECASKEPFGSDAVKEIKKRFEELWASAK